MAQAIVFYIVARAVKVLADASVSFAKAYWLLKKLTIKASFTPKYRTELANLWRLVGQSSLFIVSVYRE